MHDGGGGCRFRTSLYQSTPNFSEAKAKKNGRGGPVFQVPCIHPRRASTQGDERKAKSFQNECELQRGWVVQLLWCGIHVGEKRGVG